MLISLDGGMTFQEASDGVQVIYEDVDIPGVVEPGEVHINLTNGRSAIDIWAGENDHIASKEETVDELVRRLSPQQDRKETPTEFDESSFMAAVEKHWKYHSACNHRLWSSELIEDEVYELRVAPVFQEILGGSEDGQKVWTAFGMNLSNLFAEPGLAATEIECRSYCFECTNIPFVGIRGNYKGHPFVLMIYLEPVRESEPLEVIDRINHEVRPIKEAQP